MVSDSLRNQVLSGVAWSTFARISQQVVQFGISVILARLLLPEDFGSVGMVMVFAGFANLMADMGFATALVQRQEIRDQHTHSVYWLNLAVSGLLAALMFASAPLVAWFYDRPVLVPLTRVLSLTFVISAPGMVPAALLQRRMAFDALARTNIAGTIVSGVVGVALAYLGAGVWSLVAQTLTARFIMTALNVIWVDWRPRLSFSWTSVKELFGFTLGLFGFNFINYWARNSDNMLIGRFFGSASLGYYSRSYALMLMPITHVVGVIASVMLPALSSIQEEPSRVKGIYLRAMSAIALVVSPIMIGLAVTAEPFVLVIYGERWMQLIPLLQILALVGLMQTFVNPTGWLYTSQGRTDWMFWWGAFASVASIVSILVGVALGSVQTVAWCYAAANVVLFYPAIAIPGRLVGLSFRELIGAISGPLVGTLLMGTLVFLLGRVVPSTWSSVVKLLVLVSAGVLLYSAFILAVRPRGWREISAIALTRFRSWRASTATVENKA